MARNQLENAVASLRSMVAAPAAKDQNDRELIRAYLSNNDQVAFAALVKRYGPLVFGVCKRLLPHREDVEDCFQAVFIVLARHATALSKRTSLAGWLHRVSHRIALNCRRADIRRGRYESEATTMAPPNPERQAVWNEVQAILDEEIQRLPDKYREPFLLCHMQNMSCARAARQLGIKEGTIWSRLSEARLRLQNRLTRRGIAPTFAAAAVALEAIQANASLPAGLAAAAAKAGLAWKAGAFPAGVMSERVAALVRGDTATLLVTKVKLGAVFVLGFGAIVGAAGLYASTDGLRARQAVREEPKLVVAQKPAQAPARPRRNQAIGDQFDEAARVKMPGKELGVTWNRVIGPPKLAILQAICDQTQANFEKILTWKGDCHIETEQVLSRAFVVSNFAADFKGREPVALRQHFKYRISFALDTKSASAFWDKQTESMGFKDAESGTKIEIKNAKPSDGHYVSTPDHFLEFQPDAEWPGFSVLPDNPDAQNKRAAFLEPALSRTHRSADLIDPRDLFGFSSIQKFWQELGLYSAALLGKSGEEQKAFAEERACGFQRAPLPMEIGIAS